METKQQNEGNQPKSDDRPIDRLKAKVPPGISIAVESVDDAAEDLRKNAGRGGTSKYQWVVDLMDGIAGRDDRTLSQRWPAGSNQYNVSSLRSHLNTNRPGSEGWYTFTVRSYIDKENGEEVVKVFFSEDLPMGQRAMKSRGNSSESEGKTAPVSDGGSG